VITHIKSIAACGALLAAFSANASDIVLNFAGLNGTAEEAPLNYYDGGTGSLGSGPGPNYGITFGADAITCSGQPGGTCNTAMIPGGAGANTLFFLNGSGDVMNKASGFTTGFSFYYSAASVPGVVDVYSGLNGTGSLLAQINLPVTGSGSGTSGCYGTDYCPYTAIGVTFAGTAESVNFSGTANYIGFADITLGSSTAGGGTTTAPEIDPSSAGAGLVLLLGGVAVLRGRRKGSTVGAAIA
jgi:hypothetical protein